MFKNVKIKTKLLGGFAIVIILTAVLGIIAYQQMGHMELQTSILGNAENAQKAMLNVRAEEKNYVLRGDQQSLNKHGKYLEEVKLLSNKVKSMFTIEDNRKLADVVLENIPKYKSAFVELQRVFKEKKAALSKCEEYGREFENAVNGLSIDLESKYKLILIAEKTRRVEKNFILRADLSDDFNIQDEDEFTREIYAKISKLKSEVEALRIGASNKASIKNILDSYWKAFIKYHALAGESHVVTGEDGNLVQSGRTINATYATLTDNVMAETGRSASSAGSTIIVLLILAVVIGAGTAIFINNSITVPLNKIVDTARSIGDGDLTQNVEIYQGDEIGQLADAFRDMSDNLRKMLSGVNENAVEITVFADEFSVVSNEMLSNANGMNEKSNSAASASEEMSANMSTVSAAAEQSSTNINVVATATEEMTSTINEISQNTGKAQQIAADAVNSVNSASSQVNELGVAAKEISKVIEVIVEISEQTKLLALNATIEAARAGEAGKGFSVVANEIKELANQTNTATEDIRKKIEAIQGSTDGTVSEIKKINTVMNNVNEIVAGIATAVEEQSVTTKDIANNIGQAALGVKDMTTNVTQAASATSMIAADITSIDQASNDVKAVSERVGSGVSKLAEMGNNLKTLVGGFRI